MSATTGATSKLTIPTGPNPNPHLNKQEAHREPYSWSSKHSYLQGALTSEQNRHANWEKYSKLIIGLIAIPLIAGLSALATKRFSTFAFLGKVFTVLASGNALYQLYDLWKTPDIFRAIPGKYFLLKKAVVDAQKAGNLPQLLTTRHKNETPLQKATRPIGKLLVADPVIRRSDDRKSENLAPPREENIFLDPVAAEYLKVVSNNPTFLGQPSK